ncbi:helix-turn-helix domain-containing protein [Arcicella sp. DC2W]|uniref:Helix-turn-helix domain-containing protein n=1 Tax=Arcicella gelida TaxID=2984195 RepID=A0ABU5S547_9BACT|nr:helix-turn-helix domain-containing protein [Arcicella sp. DC2W]MEA5403566.1 helix-turn-helix domain-containing protein [Arcicella sp. DC2W]
MKTPTINLDEIEIKPITNQADFERASALIDALVDADLIEDEATRNKALDILEAITILAIDYEKKHFPIEKLDIIESIKQRIEMLNLSQKEVAEYFGGENRVSEVLNRKRPLTLKMVKNLYHGLGIPAEVLLA